MRRVAKYEPDSGRLMAVYPSLKAAAETIFGGNDTCICACCNGRQKTAYGYVWKYYQGHKGEQHK